MPRKTERLGYYPRCCKACLRDYKRLRTGNGHLIDQDVEEIAAILAELFKAA